MPGSVPQGVKSINYYTGALAVQGTNAVAITAVNTAKAVIQPLGALSGTVQNDMYYQLTNSTTVTLTSPTGAATTLNCSFAVIEYW